MQGSDRIQGYETAARERTLRKKREAGVKRRYYAVRHERGMERVHLEVILSHVHVCIQVHVASLL